ncbi:ABC transporter substrate-binding protein [Saccharomonospora sp. NPDC046836]|uniref:ABC transporter substrate-binding protein n=1 Tax=Saccharomonospora sp. NPDC046836 TaxID=3156921 RepID=UPI0033C2BC34
MAAALLLASCGTSSDDAGGSSAAGDRTLTIGAAAAPFPNLNPAQALFASYLPLTNQSILTLEEDGTISPGLAESFGYVGEGNTTFQLTFRQDAKFSDGSQVNAAAAKTWFEYMAATPGPFQAALKVGSVDVVSEWEVRLNLAEANPLVPWVLSSWTQGWGGIASPNAVADPDGLATNPAGAGPYKLDPAETVTGDHYTFVPNEFYFDADSRTRWDKVVYRVISNPSTLLQAVQTGQVDMYLAGGTTFPTVKTAESSGMATASFVGNTDLLFFGNLETGPFSDIRVRQAVNYALDRESINQVTNVGYGTPTSALTTLDGDSADLRGRYGHDPERARALLAEAGYPNGFATNTSCAATNLTQCQAIAQSLMDIGITMKIEVDQTSSQLQLFQSGQRETFVALWPVNYNLFNYASFWGGKATFRVSTPEWNDPEIDAAFQKALTAPADESIALMHQVVERAQEQAYFAPVFDIDQIFVYDPDKIAPIASSDSRFAYSMARLNLVEPK